MSGLGLTLRWVWIAIGISWIMWIAVEDRGLTLVAIEAAVISAGLGASAALQLISRIRPRGWRLAVWLAVIGALAGASWGPLAAVLMALKTSLHSHPIPDFEAADVALVLRWVPLWTGIGMLLGLGMGVVALGVQIGSRSDD